MNEITLLATKRTLKGKKVKTLRRREQLPAVVYGRKIEPETLTLDSREFEKVYQQAGTSSLVDLVIEDKDPRRVLIHEPQYDPVTSRPIHVDLYAVRMDEKIETEIPIKFIGQSPAVEEQGGNFIANLDSLRVRCLPADLISEIEVDISGLVNLEDQIRLSDIKLSEKLEVLDDQEEVLALVEAPRSEEELEAELAEDKTSEEEAVEELGKEKESESETKEETTNQPSSEEIPEKPAE